MAKLVYLIFNLLVFLPVLVLSLKSDVRPHTKRRALLRVFGLVSVPFIVWDVWAARNGHWLFNESYILSPRIMSLPIEEILFFITVPFAMIFVWGSVQKHVKDRVVSRGLVHSFLGMLAVLSAALALLNWDKGYTRSVGLAVFATCCILLTQSIAYTRRFWVFQANHIALFFVSNTVLTALPVIQYGDGSYLSQRIGTIPVEDFFFSFALISSAILVWIKQAIDKKAIN